MSSQKIAVVTDSTAYIPETALGEFSIPVIPLWVIWGDERFRDGVDIDPPTFYKRLEGSDSFPTTSQPSVGEFVEFFKKVSAGADAIVGVFISSRLSGTIASAIGAQEQIDVPLRIVDSLSASMGLGFCVLAAARAAAEGRSLDQVVAAAESVRDKMNLIFVVDTLEYLYRGGRIGGASRLLGTALKIKPLLHLEDGRIEPLAKVRTKAKAVAETLNVLGTQMGGKTVAEAAVLDVNAPEEGDALAAQVAAQFGVTPVYRTQVSPVIGTHVGPGTVGVCIYPKS